MEASATVTSKGQVTIPAAVRRALGIRHGTRLVFRIDGDEVVIEHPPTGRRAVVERFPDFFELAGSVAIPSHLEGASWARIRSLAHEQQAERSR